MNIEITTHDGKVYRAEVEGYNAAKLAKELNEQPHGYMAFGNVVLPAHTIKTVTPALEVEVK